MRFFPILIVALCLTTTADSRPFRRASCAGGSCNVEQSAAVDAKKINPLDLTMTAKAAPVAQPITVQAPTCSGGQCGVQRLRLFRR